MHDGYLDYNGLYEYFYQMKYGEKFTAEKEVVGIPAEKVPSRLLGKRSRLQNKQQGPVSKHRSRQQMLLSGQCIIP